MKTTIRPRTIIAATFLVAGAAAAQAPAGISTEEFGLSPKQLVEAVEKVETVISKCMREQGFEYVAVDYNTVRRAMAADKNLPSLSEKQFIAKQGFGVSTSYTGEPPQLSGENSPGKLALGERNVKIYKSLSPADQVAYNRALFGENTGATFAVGLDTENFALTAGCTRQGIAQVFAPDQIKGAYYNPKDALINKDSRMKAALQKYAAEMRKAGFDYNHPDDVEFDIRKRLAALTNGSTIPVDKMTPSQRAALKELQDHERRAAAKSFQLQEELIDPIADRIEQDMFGRKPQ
jgi:hypothetical protein